MARCRLHGTFTLRSGQTSTEYFDKYLFESDPALLARVAGHMAALIPPDTELLGGLELGGVPLASVLSQVTGIPALFVRKQAPSPRSALAAMVTAPPVVITSSTSRTWRPAGSAPSASRAVP